MQEFKIMEPKNIIAGILAAGFEVLLIVALLAILNSSPVEIESEDYLNLNVRLSSAEKTTAPEKEPEIRESTPDPVFEALQTFKPPEKKKEPDGVTAGIKTIDVGKKDSPTPPEGFFAPKDIDFGEMAPVLTKKTIDKKRLFDSDTVSFTELAEYDIPNLDSVRSGLERDYQRILQNPSVRRETVTGTVIVELFITGSGETEVDVRKAVSPELTNIVIKNLKLLRLGKRIDPIQVRVEVDFSPR